MPGVHALNRALTLVVTALLILGSAAEPAAAAVAPAPSLPRVPAAPSDRCATASADAVAKGRWAQKRVQKPQTPIGNVRTAGSSDLMASVRDGLRYAVTNDLTTRLAPYLDQPYYDATRVSPSLEESIRRSANETLAAAILLTTTRKAHPPGITRAQLTDFARWQIRSLACQHGAITPGGWGNTWQSALWAVTIGQAAWMMWPKLTRYERSLVAMMVITEAEAAGARGPRYFRNRVGDELTPGDSQADEVSWDLMAPALALAMMPEHPNAPRWRRSLIAMSLAAFARPQDLHRATSYNGVRIDIRLPGTNANEDGTVTNHGIVNPDYTQNVQHLWWAASLLRAGGVPVPESLFVNADIVYRGLANVVFTSPPYAEPGGTVYQPGGRIYYPMGVSWGVRRPATFVGVDAFARQYAAKDTRAAQFLRDHAADARALQLRFPDGRMYAPGSGEDSYKLGKEEYALQQMALAWWAGAIGRKTPITVDRTAYPGISLGVGTPIG